MNKANNKTDTKQRQSKKKVKQQKADRSKIKS